MPQQTENILALAALTALIIGCLLVLAPFLSAILWAVVICFSTWGVYERLLAAVKGRAALAAALMTTLLAAILLGPFVIVAVSLGENTNNLAQAIRSWISEGPPQPPDWVATLPLFGPKLHAFLSGLDTGQFYSYLRKIAAPASRWALGTGIAFGQGLLYLALSVLTAYFLYRDGSDVAKRARAGMERIAGARAHHLLEVAGSTVKGVVNGIIGAAIAQGVMAGFGFWIAGVPGPFLLGLLTCFLALIPMGPPLIWIPAVIWLFHGGHTGWGIFMLIWGATAISSIDNVVKPYLISQGSRLPFILVLLGVLGGVLSFGVIGIFLGPTLLAVGYALLMEWTRAGRKSGSPATNPPHAPPM